MDNRSIIIFALTGLVAGYLASFIVGPSSWGLLGYLVSGVLGAFVGGWLLKTAGVNLGIKNEVASLVATSTIGAIVVVLLARLIT